MASKQVPKTTGMIIGIFLAGAAIYSVFVVDWSTEVTPEEPPVRPLKTFVVESPFKFSGREYPGKIKASQEVDLAFHVSGPMIEFPVKKGEEVEKDFVIARIDPRDFENTYNAKKALLTKAEHDVEKVERLFEQDVANQQEVVDAKSAFDVAEADASIAEKALQDTYLRAPFGGVIANTFVENFENVLAKQRIVSLQDVSSVEIEVNVPEERVALSLKEKDKVGFVATFDYLPGRKFEADLKEFATVADPATQTYAVTLSMPAPRDVSILPGMTATVTTYRKDRESAEDGGFNIPINAVAIDGSGQYYVWRVEGADGGSLMVHRVDVSVGELMQDQILVIDGIEKGDRIASAGVHQLQEGRRIRLLQPEPGDATQ